MDARRKNSPKNTGRCHIKAYPIRMTISRNVFGRHQLIPLLKDFVTIFGEIDYCGTTMSNFLDVETRQMTTYLWEL